MEEEEIRLRNNLLKYVTFTEKLSFYSLIDRMNIPADYLEVALRNLENSGELSCSMSPEQLLVWFSTNKPKPCGHTELNRIISVLRRIVECVDNTKASIAGNEESFQFGDIHLIHDDLLSILYHLEGITSSKNRGDIKPKF